MTDETNQDPPIQGEVIATGTVVNSQAPGLGAILEKAMVDAVHWCHSQGITVAEEILAYKMKVFEETKAAYEAYVASMNKG